MMQVSEAGGGLKPGPGAPGEDRDAGPRARAGPADLAEDEAEDAGRDAHHEHAEALPARCAHRS